MNTPHAYDPFDDIVKLVAWFNRENGVGADEQRLRVVKIGEEVGEMAAALIGMVGQNPRKGVTHHVEEFVGEIADVAVSALVAMASLTAEPDADQLRSAMAYAIVATLDGQPQCTAIRHAERRLSQVAAGGAYDPFDDVALHLAFNDVKPYPAHRGYDHAHWALALMKTAGGAAAAVLGEAHGPHRRLGEVVATAMAAMSQAAGGVAPAKKLFAAKMDQLLARVPETTRDGS